MLSMLGIGMILAPEAFIDDLVCTECVLSRAQRAAVLSPLGSVTDAAMDVFIRSQMHLSRCVSLGTWTLCF